MGGNSKQWAEDGRQQSAGAKWVSTDTKRISGYRIGRWGWRTSSKPLMDRAIVLSEFLVVVVARRRRLRRNFSVVGDCFVVPPPAGDRGSSTFDFTPFRYVPLRVRDSSQ